MAAWCDTNAVYNGSNKVEVKIFMWSAEFIVLITIIQFSFSTTLQRNLHLFTKQFHKDFALCG